MSHSQFRRVKTYTETCMDESLRQAYDYWQDQPGSFRRRLSPKKSAANCMKKFFVLAGFPVAHSHFGETRRTHAGCDQVLKHTSDDSIPDHIAHYYLHLVHS